jgi:hypothetical protein
VDEGPLVDIVETPADGSTDRRIGGFGRLRLEELPASICLILSMYAASSFSQPPTLALQISFCPSAWATPSAVERDVGATGVVSGGASTAISPPEGVEPDRAGVMLGVLGSISVKSSNIDVHSSSE